MFFKFSIVQIEEENESSADEELKTSRKHQWSSERKTRSFTILGKVERINGRGGLVQLWLPGLPFYCHTIPQAHFWLFFCICVTQFHILTLYHQKM